MTEQERTTERWTFGGSRVSKDKRTHAWIDHDGKELWFKSSGSYSVGAVYDAKVVRDGARVSLYGNPTFTGSQTDDRDLHGRLAAEHRAAEVELQRRAHEARIKRDDPAEMAIEHLIQYAASIAPSQRQGFATYVASRISRGA